MVVLVLLVVQMVLEVLCCPGSRYKHGVKEDTALPLSKEKHTQTHTEVHFVRTRKDIRWIVYKFTFINFKLDSKKDTVTLSICHPGYRCRTNPEWSAAGKNIYTWINVCISETDSVCCLYRHSSVLPEMYWQKEKAEQCVFVFNRVYRVSCTSTLRPDWCKRDKNRSLPMCSLHFVMRLPTWPRALKLLQVYAGSNS